MGRVSLLNFHVDSIRTDVLIDTVFERINNKQKSSIFFVNALKAYEINKNPKILKVMNSFDFVLPDGVPVVWASKLLGRNLPERIAGIDLFQLLLKRAEKNGKTVYFLGSTEKNLSLMCKNIKKEYPKLRIAGYRNGYFAEEQNVSVVEEINNSDADILFLGFGSPKKEQWTYDNRHLLNTPVIQGVGGSFDVLAGVVSRAPKWMQISGLEWLYRVYKEPRRMFKRYLITNTYFIYLTAKHVLISKTIKTQINYS
ncbi:WecB/TagA/CpsF family glycosyltransferase [Chitinispirillales bacterium ANBcel5]|uniref:WecB/TagA/CpsF family glycosyltransferase n=1 Tax=Cellulosispirillum alkaliphilum TaxID=3039283 RepID=UPI002A4FD2D5|nr:WecB/TagA/CpsF family glycosyltransferase [Chitinispirillales bacterium ANBcel5]